MRTSTLTIAAAALKRDENPLSNAHVKKAVRSGYGAAIKQFELLHIKL